MSTDDNLQAILARLARLEASEATLREENCRLRTRLEVLEEHPPLPSFHAVHVGDSPPHHPDNSKLAKPLDMSIPATSTGSSLTLSATSRPHKTVPSESATHSSSRSSCATPPGSGRDVCSAARHIIGAGGRQHVEAAFLSPSIETLPCTASPPSMHAAAPYRRAYTCTTAGAGAAVLSDGAPVDAAKVAAMLTPAGRPAHVTHSPPEFALVGFSTNGEPDAHRDNAAPTQCKSGDGTHGTADSRGGTPRFSAVKEVESPLSRLALSAGIESSTAKTQTSGARDAVSGDTPPTVDVGKPQPRQSLSTSAGLSPFSHSLSMQAPSQSTDSSDGPSLQSSSIAHKRVSATAGMTVESVSRTLIQEMAKIMMDTQRLDKEGRETTKRLRQETQSRRATAKKLVYKLAEVTGVVWNVYDRIGALEEAIFGVTQTQEAIADNAYNEDDDDDYSDTASEDRSTTAAVTRTTASLGGAQARAVASRKQPFPRGGSSEGDPVDDDSIVQLPTPISPHDHIGGSYSAVNNGKAPSSVSLSQDGGATAARRSRHTTTVSTTSSGERHRHHHHDHRHTPRPTPQAGAVTPSAHAPKPSASSQRAACPFLRRRLSHDDAEDKDGTDPSASVSADDDDVDEDRPASINKHRLPNTAVTVHRHHRSSPGTGGRRQRQSGTRIRPAQRTNSQRMVPMKVVLDNAGKSFSLQSSAGNSLYAHPAGDRLATSNWSDGSLDGIGTRTAEMSSRGPGHQPTEASATSDAAVRTAESGASTLFEVSAKGGSEGTVWPEYGSIHPAEAGAGSRADATQSSSACSGSGASTSPPPSAGVRRRQSVRGAMSPTARFRAKRASVHVAGNGSARGVAPTAVLGAKDGNTSQGVSGSSGSSAASDPLRSVVMRHPAYNGTTPSSRQPSPRPPQPHQQQQQPHQSASKSASPVLPPLTTLSSRSTSSAHSVAPTGTAAASLPFPHGLRDFPPRKVSASELGSVASPGVSVQPSAHDAALTPTMPATLPPAAEVAVAALPEQSPHAEDAVAVNRVVPSTEAVFGGTLVPASPVVPAPHRRSPSQSPSTSRGEASTQAVGGATTLTTAAAVTSDPTQRRLSTGRSPASTPVTVWASAPTFSTAPLSPEPRSPHVASSALPAQRRDSGATKGTALLDGVSSTAGADLLRPPQRPSRKVGSGSARASSGAVAVAPASPDGSRQDEEPLIALLETSGGPSLAAVVSREISQSAVARRRSGQAQPVHGTPPLFAARSGPASSSAEETTAARWTRGGRESDLNHNSHGDRHHEGSVDGSGEPSSSRPPLRTRVASGVPRASTSSAVHALTPLPSSCVALNDGDSPRPAATPLTSCLVTSVPPSNTSAAGGMCPAGSTSTSTRVRAPALMSTLLDAEGLPLDGCDVSMAGMSHHRVSITAPSPTEIDRDRRKRQEEAFSKALMNKMLNPDR